MGENEPETPVEMTPREQVASEVLLWYMGLDPQNASVEDIKAALDLIGQKAKQYQDDPNQDRLSTIAFAQDMGFDGEKMWADVLANRERKAQALLSQQRELHPDEPTKEWLPPHGR